MGWITPTERRMLELASEGWDNDEIAAQLILSSDTIGKAFHRIYCKADIHGRVPKRLQRSEAIRQYLSGRIFE